MEKKRLYKRCKNISILYGVPLYVAWKYRYNPYDIKYVKKYGYKGVNYNEL